MRYLAMFLILAGLCGAAAPIRETNTFTTDRASTAIDELFASKAINVARKKNLLIHSGLTGATDIELYAPIAYDPYRNVVICSDAYQLSGGTIFKKTTDGVNFTTIADRSQSPFTDFATELGVGSVVLFSIQCLDNGTYLLSAGKSAEYTEAQGDVPNAKIFRSTNGGASWVPVQDTKYGYVSPLQSWYAIGTHVACVEYGPKGGVTGDTARQVFLSHDSGATWTLAYDYETLADRHLHAVCFDPTDATYTTLYVSHGDSPNQGIDKLVYNAGTESWDLTNITTLFQPTGCVIHNDNIYWTSDNGTCPTVLKHNVADDTLETALRVPALLGNTAETDPVYVRTRSHTEGFWYNIRLHGGVYYIVGHSETVYDQHGVGVYASTDMEHWTCLARVLSKSGASGYAFVGGVVDNRLFVTRKTATALGQVIDVPNFRTLDMTVTDNARVNLYDTNYNPSLEAGTTTGWASSDYISSLEVYTGDAHYGAKCLRALITEVAGSTANLYTPLLGPTGVGYEWSAGDIVTFRMWCKIPADFPYSWRPRVTLFSVVEGTNLRTITHAAGAPAMRGEWFPVETTVRFLTDWDTGDYVRFSLLLSAEYTADSYILVDDIECIVAANPSQRFELNLDSVANDTSAVSLLGCGAEWTTTFRWCPLQTNNEFLTGGTLAIARIEGVAGGYLDLYWDSADSLFKLTNGTDTAASTETYLPFFFDSCTVAIQGDATGSSVTINTPYTGTITFGDFSDTPLGSQPECIKFGRNTSVYSYGAFGILRAYSSKLSEADLVIDADRLSVVETPAAGDSKPFRYRF